MNELTDFAVVVLVASAGLLLAILSSTISERLRVPAPVVFLVAAALASDVRPGLASPLDPEVVGRIGTVALIVILFAGGLEIGWRQFRDSIVPIASLGLPGTFATAAVVAGAM